MNNTNTNKPPKWGEIMAISGTIFVFFASIITCILIKYLRYQEKKEQSKRQINYPNSLL